MLRLELERKMREYCYYYLTQLMCKSINLNTQRNTCYTRINLKISFNDLLRQVFRNTRKINYEQLP